MSDIAIQFDNVGKLYKLGLVGTGTLGDDLTRWWKTSVLGQEDPFLKIGESNDRASKGNSDYVWALQNINLEIKQGDVVGFIGKNGAGKSTLLKLLSRVTTPTIGEIRTRGRIASLLEVGTGFHPELTGRENIYMNGSIMGMRKAEITRKLDEIVDFAGVERYIDTPVKRYSSGMTVRLGFAVAAFLEPEILVVDEVLAVGDAEFQKKAIGKMKDVSNGDGRTVLFVSHNMRAIKRLCNTGVFMKNGSIELINDVDRVVEYYIGNETLASKNLLFNNLLEAPGNKSIKLLAISVNPSSGRKITIDSGVTIDIRIHNFIVKSTVDITSELRTMDGVVIFHQGTLIDNPKESKEGEYTIQLTLPPNLLNSGRYVFKYWFGENWRHNLWIADEYVFEVSECLDDDGLTSGARSGVLHINLNYKTKYLR